MATKETKLHLLIDWGNTNLKFILVEQLSREAIDSEVIQKCSSIEQMLEQLPSGLVSILISSVRSAQENESLNCSLINNSQQIYFAKTSPEACGVSCAYPEPQYLGIDRWLAILEASSADETIAVIDAGSAITLDIVCDNVHLGGQIVPGKPLMQRSLKLTGQVRPQVTIENDENLLLGKSTADCVERGIETAFTGYLNYAVDQVTQGFDVDRWIVAGGDHLIVSELLNRKQQNFEVYDKLVFQGLLKLFQDI